MTDPRQHPEYVALLEAIRENPEDDAPRLILSDWLEEQGVDEVAYEIRRQVALGHVYSEHVSPRYWMASFGGPEHMDGSKSRGFVFRVTLTLEKFLATAECLFRDHPIIAVTLTDKRPSAVPMAMFAWQTFDWYIDHRYRGDPALDYLPSPNYIGHPLRDYFPRLTGLYDKNFQTSFESEELALKALSGACVSYGRQLVGLSPLPQ